jgi:hypothetical protein
MDGPYEKRTCGVKNRGLSIGAETPRGRRVQSQATPLDVAHTLKYFASG